jgi:hypothetical protein
MLELFFINQNRGNNAIVFKPDSPGNVAYPAICFLIDFASSFVMCPVWAKTEAKTPDRSFTFSLAILRLSFQMSAIQQ